MRLGFMQGSWALATEREVMPVTGNPHLTERAKARQTAKQQWQLQEAANRAPSTDMLLRPMAEAKVLAMGQGKVVAKVPATAVDTAVDTAAVTVAATAVATVVATAAQSKRK